MEDKNFRERYRKLLNRCLKEGEMPSYWKTVRLVLLLKPGKKEDNPAAFRPICLLEEESKIFERVIVNRMRKEMKENGKELADRQYGFRIGRSTNNAIEELRHIVKGKMEKDGIACMVTIDVTNAFNSIPWSWIKRGLEEHGISEDLKEIVKG